MKKALNLTSILAIVVAVGLFIGFSASGDFGPATPTIDFPGFPSLSSRTVTFEPFEEEAGGDVVFREATYWNGYSQNSTGKRERLDQVRDWLLMTTLSSSNLGPSEINRILFDLPPVRRGALNTVANFEYGTTRSRATSPGHVLALIEAGSEQQKREALEHVADEERKNLGEIPGVFDVFEYQIDLASDTAQLKRLEPVKGQDLFSPAYDYVERDLHSTDDLTQFMAAANDVTYARRVGDSIRVGGRRLPDYRGIRVEDVATIWQSERSLGAGLRGSGFSLDPQIDYVDLDRKMESTLTLLSLEATPEEMQEVRDGFARKSPDAYLALASKVCADAHDVDACNSAYRHDLLANRFQAARYDGELQGTEVGMVLFYTDLLMKVWSLNYQDATPRAPSVEDFPNKTKMRVAKVFKDELTSFPETRLWLGSLNKGYQIGKARQEILLARDATRVFAVPHDFLSNKDREDSTEPNIYNRAFMHWWNDHYEEVAQYEKEYQRLNEIMKWSQIVSWLSPSSASELGFLGNVSVAHDKVFNHWVLGHPELTFHDWKSIGFKEAGYHGSTTEALPLLKSDDFDNFGESMFLSGGVSLAERDAVAARSAVSEDVSVLSRRANLDYATSSGNTLRTIEKTEYEFSSEGGRFSTLARPDPGQRLRSLIGEFRNEPFETTLAEDTNGLVFSESAKTGALGDLRIARAGEGYRVGWNGREIDTGQSLARRISVAADPDMTLARDPSVQAVLKLNDGGYLVKPRSSNTWVRMAPSSTESSELREGFQARVSGPGADAADIDVAWVRDDLKGQLPQGSYVEIGDRTASGEAVSMLQSPRPPPASATELEFSYRSSKVKSFVDPATGKVYVKWEEIPDALRDQPELLRNLSQGTASRDAIEYASVLDLAERGDFAETARLLAEDPARFRTATDAYIQNELKAYDDLVSSGRLTEAGARLDRLTAFYGDRPEFGLRNAMTALSSGRTQPLSQLARSLEETRLPHSESFFAEIDQRIQASRSPLESDNLREFADYTAQTQGRLSHGSGTALGDLRLEMRGDRLVTDFHTARLASEPATVNELASAGDRAIYIQDSPGLNHLDFHAPISQQQLHSLSQMPGISIKKVRLADLSTYRPSAITETSTGTSFHLGSPAGSFNPTGLARIANGGGSNCSGDQSQADSSHCGFVYLVSSS